LTVSLPLMSSQFATELQQIVRRSVPLTSRPPLLTTNKVFLLDYLMMSVTSSVADGEVLALSTLPRAASAAPLRAQILHAQVSPGAGDGGAINAASRCFSSSA
jgi:hypothetical protein